jgi:hypothetical protein
VVRTVVNPNVPGVAPVAAPVRPIAAHKPELTALPHDSIVRLHAAAGQGTIGLRKKIALWAAPLAGLDKTVTGLPQPSRKK